MMILSSPGGPRKAWLSSLKRHWANSKSQIVDGTPCSNTGERGRREDTSDGDPDGGGDLDGTDGGVLVSLGVGLPFAEGECSRLRPLLSSIVGK
jgi:hypothetical protein